LTVEPRDTRERTRNLQQTNVNGYRLQTSDPQVLSEAQEVVSRHPGRMAAPHSADAQALIEELMNRFPYRLDTNFAKIDRIDHPEVEGFKRATLGQTVRGRPLQEWARLLGDLNDEDRPLVQAKAAATIQAIYDEL